MDEILLKYKMLSADDKKLFGDFLDRLLRQSKTKSIDQKESTQNALGISECSEDDVAYLVDHNKGNNQHNEKLQNMETLTIKVKSKEHLLFLYKILKSFDFVELPEIEKTSDKKVTHDFFSSAGLWKGRDISQESLRNNAWKKS